MYNIHGEVGSGVLLQFLLSIRENLFYIHFTKSFKLQILVLLTPCLCQMPTLNVLVQMYRAISLANGGNAKEAGKPVPISVLGAA